MSACNPGVRLCGCDFWALAADAGWNKPALDGAFRQGLNRRVRDALALRLDLRDLNALVAAAIELDNYFRDQQREQPGLLNSSPRWSSYHQQGLARQPTANSAALWPTQSPGEEAMQLGQSRLRPAGWRRRMSPHLLSYAAKRMSLSANTLGFGGTASSCPTLSRVFLPVTLFWSHHSLSLFLIDSGTDDWFIEHNLARQANISTEELPQPRTILDCHGTHHTALLTLVISGNLQGRIQLFNWMTGSLTGLSVPPVCHSTVTRGFWGSRGTPRPVFCS